MSSFLLACMMMFYIGDLGQLDPVVNEDDFATTVLVENQPDNDQVGFTCRHNSSSVCIR